ncbi:hypothetical protein [Paraburkholderia bengalensis]|uniref:hypothetical protein n=1 Tax=Paraburkholderia bengalensis TaxID=2747562 RepID=UPI003AF47A3D
MNDIGHDPLRRAAPAAWYLNSGLRLSDEEPDAEAEPRRYALVPALERYLAGVRYADENAASRAATLDALAREAWTGCRCRAAAKRRRAGAALPPSPRATCRS